MFSFFIAGIPNLTLVAVVLAKTVPTQTPETLVTADNVTDFLSAEILLIRLILDLRQLVCLQ